MVATSYLLGVSTRRVEKLIHTLGIDGISKSPVSEIAKSLDEQVAQWRSRPLDSEPYPFVWVDALTQKVSPGGNDHAAPTRRTSGRTSSACALGPCHGGTAAMSGRASCRRIG